MLDHHVLKILVVDEDFLLHQLQVPVILRQKVEVTEDVVHDGKPPVARQNVPVACPACQKDSDIGEHAEEHPVNLYLRPPDLPLDLAPEFSGKLSGILINHFLKLLDMEVVDGGVQPHFKLL